MTVPEPAAVEPARKPPLRIAIASGKGGTGKTLFATHLAVHLSEQGRSTTYVDADVEEPNGHLLLKPHIESRHPVTVAMPASQRFRCSRCGLCADACAFGAVMVGGGGPLFFPELCHGCGNCVQVCPDEVLVERQREIGHLLHGHAGALQFWSGCLNVGEPRATPVISELGQRIREATGDVIIDCPPGSSCSVMAAVTCADLVILVTEPTPFGWHDLLAALRMCHALHRPVAAVLNRSDLGATPVRESLHRWGVPLLASVPFSQQVAQANAQARMLGLSEPLFGTAIASIAQALSGAELWTEARRALDDSSAHPLPPVYESPESQPIGDCR